MKTKRAGSKYVVGSTNLTHTIWLNSCLFYLFVKIGPQNRIYDDFLLNNTCVSNVYETIIVRVALRCRKLREPVDTKAGVYGCAS